MNINHYIRRVTFRVNSQKKYDLINCVYRFLRVISAKIIYGRSILMNKGFLNPLVPDEIFFKITSTGSYCVIQNRLTLNFTPIIY